MKKTTLLATLLLLLGMTLSTQAAFTADQPAHPLLYVNTIEPKDTTDIEIKANKLNVDGNLVVQGLIGVGKNPTTSIDVAGTITATDFVKADGTAIASNLFQDQNGNAIINPGGVGIGTPTIAPGTKLDVLGNILTSRLILRDTGANGVSWSIQEVPNNDISFVYNGEKLSVSASGNAKVAGTITATDFVKADGSPLVPPTIQSADVWQDDDTNAFRDTGSVGIGTDTPSATLEVAGTIEVSGDHADSNLLRFVNVGGTGHTWELNPRLDGLNIFDRTTDKTTLFIDNAGNVGIGTPPPGQRLTIQSAVGQANKLELVQEGQRTWHLGTHATNPNFIIHDADQGADRITIDAAGQVGIGTDQPSETLEVAGTIKATDFVKADGSPLVPPTIQAADAWTESNGNAFRDTGRVGIGTTNPQGILHISPTTHLFMWAGLVDGTLTPRCPCDISSSAAECGIFPFESDFAGNECYDQQIGSPASSQPNQALSMKFEKQPNEVIVSTTGNVGIGTTSPTAKLNIDPQGAGGILIGDPNTGSGGHTALLMEISSQNEGVGRIQAIKSGGTAWGDIILNPSGGNVGIGSTTTTLEGRNPKLFVDASSTASTDGITIDAQDGQYFLRLARDGVNIANIYKNTADGALRIDPVAAAGTTDRVAIDGQLEVSSDRIFVSRQGLAGQYNSAQVQGIWSIGEAFNIDLAANNFGNQYGITYAHTNAGSGSKSTFSGLGHQILFTHNGNTKAGISLSNGDVVGRMFRDNGNINFYVDPASTSILNDIRPSIIYDRDNTAYYLNPASTSNVNQIYVQGNIIAESNSHGSCAWISSPWACNWGSSADSRLDCPNGRYVAGVTFTGHPGQHGACPKAIKCCEI